MFIQKEEIFKFDNQKAFNDVFDTVSFLTMHAMFGILAYLRL